MLDQYLDNLDSFKEAIIRFGIHRLRNLRNNNEFNPNNDYVPKFLKGKIDQLLEIINEEEEI